MQAQSGLFFPAKRYSNSGQPIAIARRNTLFKNRIVLGNWLFYLLSLRTGSVRGGEPYPLRRQAHSLMGFEWESQDEPSSAKRSPSPSGCWAGSRRSFVLI